MSNLENNENSGTKEIVEEVTPSVSSGNDGIESSEIASADISEQATAEVVKAETTEEVAPSVSSAKEPVYTASDLTKEIIQEKIKRSTREEFETLWIPLIMENQTSEEISKESTVEKNGSGLNSYDSKNVTYCFENIKKGNHLTQDYVTFLRKILPKYWNQYIEKALSNAEIATKIWNAGTSEEEVKSRGRGRPRKDDPEALAEVEAEAKTKAEERKKKIEALAVTLNENIKNEYNLDAGIVLIHLYDIHTFIKYIYDKFGKTESKETTNDIISLVEMGIINVFEKKPDGTITHIDDILIPTKSSGKFDSFRMTSEGIEELGYSENKGEYSKFITGCRCFINKEPIPKLKICFFGSCIFSDHSSL